MEQIDWEKYAFELLVLSTRFFSESNYNKYLTLKRHYADLEPQNDVEAKIKQVYENCDKMDQEFVEYMKDVEKVLAMALAKYYDNPVCYSGGDK